MKVSPYEKKPRLRGKYGMFDISEILERKCSVYLEATLDVIQKNKLKLMLDGGNFVFFFIHNGNVFGSDERARVMFAKMKDPKDEDWSPGWLKEANFTAVNLNKLGQGQQHPMLFTHKDLSSVEVVSKEEAYSNLERFFEKEKDQPPQPNSLG